MVEGILTYTLQKSILLISNPLLGMVKHLLTSCILFVYSQVVHNYGHISQGIGLSWGTAVYAARLAADIVKPNSGAKL